MEQRTQQRRGGSSRKDGGWRAIQTGKWEWGLRKHNEDTHSRNLKGYRKYRITASIIRKFVDSREVDEESGIHLGRDQPANVFVCSFKM